MSTAAPTRYSASEYLAFDRASHDVKHEFFEGKVFGIENGSAAHDQITANLAIALQSQMHNRGCYLSDMRIQSPAELYAYPDVMVFAGEPEFADDYHDTLLNPFAIFEIVSPATEAFDRGRKFHSYLQIRSFKEYVIVAQDRASIHHFSRRNDGQWLLSLLTDLQDILQLPSLDLAIPVAEIYATVELPPEKLK